MLVTIIANDCPACLVFKNNELDKLDNECEQLDIEHKVIDLESRRSPFPEQYKHLQKYTRFFPSFIVLIDNKVKAIFGLDIKNNDDKLILKANAQSREPRTAETLIKWYNQQKTSTIKAGFELEQSVDEVREFP